MAGRSRGRSGKRPGKAETDDHERQGSHDDPKIPDNIRPVKTNPVQNTARPWEAQGFNLKRLRRERGIDQATIADSLGVRRPTVSDWERGVQCPRQPHLERLAEILGVPVSALTTAGMLGARIAAKESEIPVLGSVAAGDPDSKVLALVRDAPQQVIAIPEGAMALRVDGDSMAPVALEGQWVICDTVAPLAGDLVVCELRPSVAVFRRLGLVTKAGTYTLESVRAGQWPTMEIEPTEIVACYRVIGVCFIAQT